MRQKRMVEAIPLIFRTFLLVLVLGFLYEVGYLGYQFQRDRSQFLAELKKQEGGQAPFGSQSPEEEGQSLGSPLIDPATSQIIVCRPPISEKTILRSRDPFSDTTFEEVIRRREEREKLLARQEKEFYSILREDYRSETERAGRFAYVVKEKPSLPPPDLENITIEGEPKELAVGPVKQKCPFVWKGTIVCGNTRQYFIGDEKRTYAVKEGESIERYCIQGKTETTLCLMKEGEMYLAKRR